MSGTSLSRSTSNILVAMKNDTRSPKNTFESKQTMFLPIYNFESAKHSYINEFRDTHYYFPRIQEKRSHSNSFLIKRGNVNAGLYSGHQVVMRDSHTSNIKKLDYTKTSNKISPGKVTDLPSGLY